MDFTLRSESVEFARSLRDFLNREVVPHRQQWDRDERIDSSLLRKLGTMGVTGMMISPEFGGAGGTMESYVLAMEELGRADSSVRGLVSVSLGLVAKSIAARGTEPQKHRWLPGLCAGDMLACFCLTEPDTGSDASSLQFRATRTAEGDYALHGSKMFITNGTWADLALVFARTGDAGPRGITAFLVPTDSPGLTRREIKGKLGLRGQPTAELAFDGVIVPAGAVLGEEGQGFPIAMEALDRGRISIAASCVGLISACIEVVREYTTTRTQFGRMIAEFQLIQEMIADMAVEHDAARLLVWQAVDLLEHGEPFGLAASKAKLFASEAAVRAANNSIQCLGGYGYIDEYPVQKFMRDARVMTLYEGTSQIQKLLIGRAVTGVNAFSAVRQPS